MSCFLSPGPNIFILSVITFWPHVLFVINPRLENLGPIIRLHYSSKIIQVVVFMGLVFFL